MPFLLKRDGNNIALEVQRWQYFLLRNGIDQAGRIDGQFGMKTETATKFFQIQQTLPTTGKLDAATLEAAAAMSYTVLPDDFYNGKDSDAWPPKPAGLKSPDNDDRNAALGCYKFKQLALQYRSDKDEIVIQGSCDGATSDWRSKNIGTVAIVQPVFAAGFNGAITGHKAILPYFVRLFARWEELDLLHLVRGFSGDFSPRYKRGKSPGPDGHSTKKSSDVSALSNHAFGSAMDINVEDNPFQDVPALMPQRGCLRQLIGPANDVGFFSGVHFGNPRDGMHFEFAAFDKL